MYVALPIHFRSVNEIICHGIPDARSVLLGFCLFL